MNKLEQSVKQDYEKEGWIVLRNGWPDFLVYREKDGKFEIKGVEVKPKNKLSLRLNQRRMMDILAKIMPIFRATGEPVYSFSSGCFDVVTITNEEQL